MKSTAILLLLLFAGCGMDGEPDTQGSGSPSIETSATEAVNRSLPDVCALSKGLRCVELTRGGVAVVYPHAPKHRRQGVLFWDPGGPGEQPLDAGAARTGLPSWTRGFDIVVLAEPWTLRPEDANCSKLIMAAGATGLPEEHDAEEGECSWDEWRNTPAAVAVAVQDIERQIGKLEGVYATSFGAVRSFPAMQRVDATKGFVVLDSPAPTSAVTGADLLDQRWSTAKNLAVETPTCSQSCTADRRRRLDDFLSGSSDVTAFEAGLGLMGIAPRLGENVRYLRAFWPNAPNLERYQAHAWKVSAHTFNRSNSAGVPRPELVSYISAICAAYSGWSEEPRNPLDAMHAPCVDFAIGGVDVASLPTLSVRAFVAINEQDPSVPLTLQKTWLSQFQNPSVETYSFRMHTSAPQEVDRRVARWLSR